MTTEQRGRRLTGRHVAMIAGGAWVVILTANISMVVAATGSFPGLVAKNSYVASQDWNMRAAERERLGLRLTAVHEGGDLVVRVTGRDGRPGRALDVAAEIGRPADARTDQTLDLVESADGWRAPVALAPGRWRVAVSAIVADPAAPEAPVRLVADTVLTAR